MTLDSCLVLSLNCMWLDPPCICHREPVVSPWFLQPVSWWHKARHDNLKHVQRYSTMSVDMFYEWRIVMPSGTSNITYPKETLCFLHSSNSMQRGISDFNMYKITSFCRTSCILWIEKYCLLGSVMSVTQEESRRRVKCHSHLGERMAERQKGYARSKN